jgi:flagellar biogenesis protein FliO
MHQDRRVWLRVLTCILLIGATGQIAAAAEAIAAAPAAATAPVAAASAPPANEAKSLGVPNSLFSSRPAAEETSASSHSILDPRHNDVVRVLLALACVVALLLGIRFVMRRAGGAMAGGGRPSGVLQVHGRYPAGRGQSMLLIQVGNRMILVHQGGGRMKTLAEFSDPEDVADLRTRLEAGKQGVGRLIPFKGVLAGEQAKATGTEESEDTVDLTGGAAGGLRRRLLGGRRLV